MNLVCDKCRHGECCRSCGGVSAFIHCSDVDIFISCAKVRCPYETYGCRDNIVYYSMSNHRVLCPYRPRPCIQRGCALLGSPPVLQRHVCGDHVWPVVTLPAYGVEKSIFVPTANMTYLVTVEADGASMFILTVRRGVPAFAIWMEHHASTPWSAGQHRCTMHVLAPDPPRVLGGLGRRITMSTDVGPYSSDPADENDGRLWLVVVPTMINPLSDTVHLRIRIE